jgi:hypothetical protein
VTWLVIDLDEGYGHPIRLEVKIKLDVVELWLGRRSVAMIDREALAAWLAEPVGTFERHEVALWVSALGPVVEVRGWVRPALVDPGIFIELQERITRQQ